MIVAIIPAKEHSNRLVNKNMRSINGKTLILHAIEYARTSKMIDLIIVSTDSEVVATHAKEAGVRVVMRGPELSGEAPLISVYRDVLGKISEKGITYVVGIQPDHPDRTAVLDDAIRHAIEKDIDDLFTLDKDGKRNGALRVLSYKALSMNATIYSSAFIDNCTNIHSLEELQMASFNMSSASKVIDIAGRKIGKNEPAFIIAEAACNHMCDMALAKKMIDEAVVAGADAIKFQTYKAEKLTTKDATAFWGEEKISQIEYYKRLDRFGENEYRELFNYANQKGIIAFSSPFDAESSDMLEHLNMPVFKIASCDICNLPHLRQIAQYGKPIILSTGASSVQEIETAVYTIFNEGNYQLILLACTLSYPTKSEDANFARIRTLKELFPSITIGVSDHTPPDEDMVIPSVAVALGAKVVEKHYTLDNAMTGSGHFFAINPHNLKKMIKNIRLAEKVTGDGTLGTSPAEEKALVSARRSIVAEVKIKAHQVITEKMLGLKRPGDGMLGDKLHLVIGKKSFHDINRDEQITLEMLYE